MSLAPAHSGPCFAVIFSSQRTPYENQQYKDAAQEMLALAATQPGYLGVESARDAQGFGITVSYWDSLEAIRAWHQHPRHAEIQRLGRERWYESFSVRVCRVEREYDFSQLG